MDHYLQIKLRLYRRDLHLSKINTLSSRFNPAITMYIILRGIFFVPFVVFVVCSIITVSRVTRKIEILPQNGSPARCIFYYCYADLAENRALQLKLEKDPNFEMIWLRPSTCSSKSELNGGHRELSRAP